MTQKPIEPCDGAKSNTPEAVLCRTCARAAPGKAHRKTFITPYVRMVPDHQAEQRPECAYHLPVEPV